MRYTPRQLREKMGLAQSEVADGAGISRSYYNEIENGERVPSYRMTHKLARFFGVRIDQIIFPAFESADREQDKGTDGALDHGREEVAV